MGKDKKILCNELNFGLMTNKIPVNLIKSNKKIYGANFLSLGKILVYEIF